MPVGDLGMSSIHERPLTTSTRAMHMLAAGATILVFYLVATGAMLVFGGLFLIMLLVAVGAARFGLAGYVTPLVGPPGRLVRIIARRLWLPSETTFRITLEAPEAPRLFDLVADLARRLAVRPPRTIVMEMHCGAWVLLGGFGRASGRTTLGLGYDLLAGLSESEVEAVLAHELAHARLVRRGFARWLNKGLARLVAVTQQLAAFREERRREQRPSDLAEASVAVFDALTVRAARLVATYSRQDEFAADRTAAAVCGAWPVRSALGKLDWLPARAARLPWSERMARLHLAEPFSRWLADELAAPPGLEGSEPARDAADPYSTHPTTRDRLAALPPADRPAVERADTGVELLAEPDRIAERLAAEIQRVLGAEERRHARRLRRATRKFSRRQRSNAAGIVGASAIVLGTILALATAGDASQAAGPATGIVLVAFGIAVYRRGSYRDPRPLPVPRFGTLSSGRPTRTREQLSAAESAMEEELRAAAAQRRGVRDAREHLIQASYAALEQPDYLRAHVASRLALKLEGNSVEALLARAIAAGALGASKQVQLALEDVRRQAGFTTTATRWGAAWAMSMLDDWNCEGLLQLLHDRDPGVATYAALLALAQFYRGKLQSAVRHAETACAVEPENHACTGLLVNTLLAAGRVRDAEVRAVGLAERARTEPQHALTLVRLHLLRRDVTQATAWARVVREQDPEGSLLIAIGAAFADARVADVAQQFFAEALAAGYGPQANMGLAALATAAGDRARARQYLLAALQIEEAKLAGAETPLTLFHEIVARLNGLGERRDCRAWIAAIPSQLPTALSGLSLLVFAPDEAAARGHVGEVVTAMRRNVPDLAAVRWREALPDVRPVRPVHPGVQAIVE